MPASVSWSGAAPNEVTANTQDGLALRGYYWPPATPDGDIIIYFHGQSGNRYLAAQRAAPLAAHAGATKPHLPARLLAGWCTRVAVGR